MEELMDISSNEIQEVIKRLLDLAEDRKSFFSGDGDDGIYRADYDALCKAAELLETYHD